METSIFSIIIPAYNSEKYIRDAINSVINQTFTKWELLIIENGSTDNTTKICEDYLSNNQIRLFHSAKGVSIARNLGIKKANSKYILFLDADDMLDRKTLEIYNSFLLNEPDLVSTRLFGNKTYTTTKLSYYRNKDVKKYLSKILEDPTQKCTVKAVLFKKQNIIDNEIAFDSNLSYCEDSAFLIEYILHVKFIINTDKATYIYRYNPVSTVRKANEAAYIKYILACKKIVALLNNQNFEIKNALYVFILTQLLIIFVHNTFSNANNIEKQISDAKNIMKQYPFSMALKNLRLRHYRGYKKIMFYLLQKNNISLIALICKIRNFYNIKKGKKNV